jgi:hypothetical protein
MSLTAPQKELNVMRESSQLCRRVQKSGEDVVREILAEPRSGSVGLLRLQHCVPAPLSALMKDGAISYARWKFTCNCNASLLLRYWICCPINSNFMSIEAGGKFQGSRGGGLLETEPGIVHALLLFRAVELAR